MKNKLSINVFFLILIVIYFITLMTDYLTYFLNFPYIVNLLISTSVSLIFVFLIRKKLSIKMDFKKSDIIFFLLLLGIFLITFVYPDIAFDTVNYHIYLQENPFGDKIFTDFFAGKNLNSFSYAFPDRIHYIFRNLLGYRLGIICNYLVAMVLFYQTKDIMKKFLKNANSFLISIFATLSVLTLSIVELIDNYYIDLFSLVTLMEIIRLLLNETFIYDNKYDLFKTGYLALLFGFAVAIKISNLPILALLFIVFLIKSKFSIKKLNLKLVVSCLICGLFPFILYFTYTYLATGNPVFPFYNTIFKSPYYSLTNWLDTRFGPHNFKETLFWPIYVIIHSNRGVDSGVIEYFWACGYVLSFIYLIIYILKYMKHQQVNLSKMSFFILVILINLFWSKFQLGYTRYGMPVILLSNITFYIFVYDVFKRKNYVILGLAFIYWLSNFAYSSYHYFYSHEYWLFNNYNQQDRGIDYKENLQKMLKNNQVKIELPDNSVWGIINYNAAYATLLNNNNNIINLNASVSNAKTEEILNTLLNGKNIYTMTDILNFNNFINYLNESNYYIQEYYNTYNPSFMRYKERIYVFKIAKSAHLNTYEGVNTKKSYPITKDASTISFIAGIEKSLVETMTDEYYLEVKKVNKNGEEILDIIKLEPDGKLINYQKEVSLKTNDTITITILDKNKKELSDNWFMLINLETI